ncbi:putative membrane protein [Stenotrophomonas phage C121]|uniref:hypothetical protein n=1 Tax=Stenotrophomonas phage C121 TaxID=2914029 RepID=UPI002329056F|nr:hypothetical protein PP752_gp77 [Stenotrophomonas phage C121]UKL14810.1 putative membrane protein [Stenotrophomonas phage C121]
MGFLGSSKKTYVSSVAYNLAGDIAKRANYLKTTIVGAIAQEANIPNSITRAYLKGPGLKFRHFAKWAEDTGYNTDVGLVKGDLFARSNVDYVVISDRMSQIEGGQFVGVTQADTGDADYTYWADKWVLENHPTRINTEYRTDFNWDTKTLTVVWADTSVSTTVINDIDSLSRYLYIQYNISVDPTQDPVVVGPTHTLAAGEDFPSTTGWTKIDDVTDPNGDTHEVWRKETFMGTVAGTDRSLTKRENMYFDTVASVRTWRIDTQNRYSGTWSNPKIYIYKQNSGDPILDDMFRVPTTQQSFYPFMPIRLDNKFLSDTYMPELYAKTKKAFTKATGGKLTDIIKSLEDNPDLGDIDYVYAMYGVSLNTKEEAARRYVYKFFQLALQNAGNGIADYAAYKAKHAQAKASWDTWISWKEAQSRPGDPQFGKPEPARQAYPQMPVREIKVNSENNQVMNYDIKTQWNSIEETTGTGKLKPDVKVNEIWFEKAAPESFEESVWVPEDNPGGVWGAMNIIRVGAVLILNWQTGPNNWRRMRITGLMHRNVVYNGKSVDITAGEAMDDTEESGFIIPLHPTLYRQMGMKDMTQMATACSYLLLNCYQVVKKKWYQTGLFQVVLIIVIIVVSIYTGGAGAGASGGLLGTNAAVGAAIGLTGAAAIIVGAIANALAAMLVAAAIQKGAVALFGDKWGNIIGAIVAVIALQVGTAMANGQNMSSAMSGLTRADNLLMLTQAAGQGYGAYIQSAMGEINAEMAQLQDQYKEQSKVLQQAWEQLGNTGGTIDPAAITSALNVTAEDMDTFLQRTGMYGSDIAQMSMDLLYDFASISLQPPSI